MNQIYKFSDPTSGFIHYILSKDIKKNLKYLDYLYRAFIKNPNQTKTVNSPLVRYLVETKKPFTAILMDLVFESEDATEVESKLLELRQEIQQQSIPEQSEILVEQKEEVETKDTTEKSVEPVDPETPVPLTKKRGRKKKVVQETIVA